MKYTTEDDIRDYVARFILASAQEVECLTESIVDLLPEGLDEDEFYYEDEQMSDLAYEMFDRATVSVVIDEVEYNG